MNSASRNVSSYLAGAVTDGSKDQINPPVWYSFVLLWTIGGRSTTAALEIFPAGSDKHSTGLHVIDLERRRFVLHIVSVS